MTNTVLVVEDDAANAQMLRDALVAEGFEVLLAEDGDRGLEDFAEHAAVVGLILVDVCLPKTQGFDLVAAIRARDDGQHVPFVVMSGVYRSTTYREVMMKRHDITAYFDKPVDLDALFDVVRSVFASAKPGDVRAPSPARRPEATADEVDVRMLSTGEIELIAGPSLGTVEAPAEATVDATDLVELQEGMHDAPPRMLEDVLREKAKSFVDSEEQTTVDLEVRRQSAASERDPGPDSGPDPEAVTQYAWDTGVRVVRADDADDADDAGVNVDVQVEDAFLSAEVNRPEARSPRPLVTRSQGAKLIQATCEPVLLRLQAQYANMRRQDYYALLGVSTAASADAIDTAQTRRLQVLNPERMLPNPCSAEVRLLLEQMAALVVRAAKTLAHPEARHAYDASIGREASGPVVSAIAAEEAFEAGVRAASAGDWALAKTHFREAAERNTEDGEYLAYFAWALFTEAPDRAEVVDEALTLFGRALERAPNSADTYVFRGLVHQRGGRLDEARTDFQRAVEIDGDNVRALAALRTLRPAVQQPVKTGLFSRLTN